MLVVADHHHSVLWESLALLFVDRAILGPTELAVWAEAVISSPIVTEFGRPVTVLENPKPDIVIATTGGMRERMRSFAHKHGALYIDHIANVWDEPIGPFVLRAAIGKGTQGLFYHPEFHRLPYTPPRTARVGSFHASYLTLPCFTEWERRERSEWVLYGTHEHPLRPHEVAQARMDCLAIWHCKDTDGYGFGVHEAFASGRAVIGHKRHYAGLYAEPLFIRGVTYLEPEDPFERLDDIGRQAREHFDALVDFDREAIAVRDYLTGALGGT